MKKTLLAFSTLCVALSATAEERYYVIKDGQVVDGIVQRAYYVPGKTDAEVEPGAYDTIISGKEYDGRKVAAYIHGKELYKDVRFDLSEAPIDLSKTWVMTLKYRMPFIADSANYNTYQAVKDCSADDGTKPAIFFGLSADPDSMAMNTMDYLFNVQAAVESFRANGDWMTKELYLVAPSFLKEAKSFIMGYAREGKPTHDISEEPLYIEELSFHSAGEFPFFAEDFSPKMSNVWSDSPALNSTTAQWKSGATFEVGDEALFSARVWDKPWDDSEVPATEIAHAANLLKPMKFLTIKDIALPEGVSSIAVHALVKASITEKNQAKWDAMAETPEGRPVTVLATFDDGTEAPVFPDYVRKSQWDWAISEVAVPAGAKSVSLKFVSSDCSVALLLNEVLISKAPIDLTPYFGKAASNGVVDFSSVPGAEVYVADDVVVAAENATKVEVISLNGVIVASADANSVNIAGLAEGVYVVRVTTAEGVAAAIIKK